VDVKRKRIALTMRKDGGEAAPQPMREKGNAGAMRHANSKPQGHNEGSQSGGALAAALAEAMKRR